MTSIPCKNVLVFGGSGTAGRATVEALLQAGHSVTCFGRSDPKIDGSDTLIGDVLNLPGNELARGFDAVVSCLASRTGAPVDAWRIDHQAQSGILKVAKSAGISQFVLLSAICVQKPMLAFQQAKLAFEAELTASNLTYSIVRPTAFFKSLSGQIERVKNGKPFMLFGDGTRTACKPISDRDLGVFIADCLNDPDKANRILPIGGPGPAMTLREQGELLFELVGKTPRFKQVPVGFMTAIIKGLDLAGLVNKAAKDKAQLARIGRYYATESMLVWDGARYDADSTPSFGKDTLRDHYAGVLAGKIVVDRGDHAIF
jgi:divinyl chlorophyllide a 8-vinyl-reductase